MPSTSTSNYWSIYFCVLVAGLFVAPCNVMAKEPLVIDTHKEFVTTVLNDIDGFSDGKMAATRECHARYVDQNIPEPLRSKIPFSAICFEVSFDQKKEDISKRYGGTYSSSSKKWIAYYDSESDRKLLSPASRIYTIKAVNSNGFARTTDEIIGDPDQRVRFFSYCLFHDAQAICGDGQVMRLADPKGNLLPYALEILRSVQFTDSEVAGPAARASSSSTSPQ